MLDACRFGQIVDIQLRRLDKMLAGQGLSLRLTDRARAFVAEAGFDPAYGARRGCGRRSRPAVFGQVFEGFYN